MRVWYAADIPASSVSVIGSPPGHFNGMQSFSGLDPQGAGTFEVFDPLSRSVACRLYEREPMVKNGRNGNVAIMSWFTADTVNDGHRQLGPNTSGTSQKPIRLALDQESRCPEQRRSGSTSAGLRCSPSVALVKTLIDSRSKTGPALDRPKRETTGVVEGQSAQKRRGRASSSVQVVITIFCIASSLDAARIGVHRLVYACCRQRTHEPLTIPDVRRVGVVG
jgi:hypothetical protein